MIQLISFPNFIAKQYSENNFERRSKSMLEDQPRFLAKWSLALIMRRWPPDRSPEVTFLGCLFVVL